MNSQIGAVMPTADILDITVKQARAGMAVAGSTHSLLIGKKVSKCEKSVYSNQFCLKGEEGTCKEGY